MSCPHTLLKLGAVSRVPAELPQRGLPNLEHSDPCSITAHAPGIVPSKPAKNGRKGPGPAIPFNAPGISKEAPARDVPAEQGGLAAKKSPQERALAMER